MILGKVAATLADHRSAGRIAAGLLAAAALARIAWLVSGDNRLAPLGNESEQVAAALVTGRGFADAFEIGSGATAHLAPTTPLLTAASYALFGVGTPAAALVLTAMALAVTIGGFVLAWRAFAALGAPVEGRLLALAMVALVPLQFGLELREFRSWEGGIAAALVAAMLLWTLRLDARQRLPAMTLLRLGAANGAIALISPAAGLASCGMIGVLLLRRVEIRRWAIPVVATAVVVAALVLPWAMRNERALGAPVPLRTGVGIGLAVVYRDEVLIHDRPTTYYNGLALFGPNSSPVALAAYKRLGEVAYNRKLQAQAVRWMAAHPAATLRIRLENLRDFYLPPAWHFNRFGNKSQGVGVRAALMAMASIAGLLTLAAMLWQRRWRYLYPAAAVLLPCVPYIFSYPLLRYRYVVSTLLIFLAFDGASRLLRHFRGVAAGTDFDAAPKAANSL